MAAKSGEAACKQATEFAMYGASAMAAVGLLSGLVYSRTACDLNLSEWNLVNAILAGSIGFISYFAIKVSPKALQLGYKVLTMNCTFNELLADGVLPASVSVGQAVMPILALIWAIHGISGAGYGTCSFTAPLLFGLTMTEMLVQIAAIVAAGAYILYSAGYTIEKLKDLAYSTAIKVKDFSKDLVANFPAHMKKAFDAIVEYLKIAYEFIVKYILKAYEFLSAKCKVCCEKAPKLFTAEYWRGSEGSPLLG